MVALRHLPMNLAVSVRRFVTGGNNATPSSLSNSASSHNNSHSSGVSPRSMITASEVASVDQPAPVTNKGKKAKKKRFTFHFWALGSGNSQTTGGNNGGYACKIPKGLPLLISDDEFELSTVDEAQLLHARELYLRTPDSSRSVSFVDSDSWPYIDDDVGEEGSDSDEEGYDRGSLWGGG